MPGWIYTFQVNKVVSLIWSEPKRSDSGLVFFSSICIPMHSDKISKPFNEIKYRKFQFATEEKRLQIEDRKRNPFFMLIITSKNKREQDIEKERLVQIRDTSLRDGPWLPKMSLTHYGACWSFHAASYILVPIDCSFHDLWNNCTSQWRKETKTGKLFSDEFVYLGIRRLKSTSASLHCTKKKKINNLCIIDITGFQLSRDLMHASPIKENELKL